MHAQIHIRNVFHMHMNAGIITHRIQMNILLPYVNIEYAVRLQYIMQTHMVVIVYM